MSDVETKVEETTIHELAVEETKVEKKEEATIEGDEKVERQEQAKDAEEFGNPFAVEVHTQLSAFSRSHAGISRVGLLDL